MSGPPSINTTFGAAFLGLVIGSVLYGLTCMQTYVYYRAYPRDVPMLKLFVFFLWILDTTHMILSTTTIYWYLILNFNNPDNLDVGYWAMNLQTDCNGLIGVMVELFFALRVWKVSKSRLLTLVICILAVLHFSLGVYFTVEGFELGRFSKYSKLTWVTCVGLGSAAACDILIASSLVYYLSRSRTGFKQSDSIISTLMLYAINTGLLTSICATFAVICFGLMPTNFVWLGFFWCLGKLYTNSLLASLNSREALRRIAENREPPLSLNPTSFRNYRESSSSGHGKTSIPGPFSPIAIVVDTTRERKSDYDTIEGGSSPITKAHPLSPISENESGSQSSVRETRPNRVF